MPPIPRGLYERILTELLAERVSGGDIGGEPAFDPLRPAEASDRLAMHVAAIMERVLDAFPDDERVPSGVKIARRIIELLATDTQSKGLTIERPALPPQVLRAIQSRLPDGQVAQFESPLIPLLDTTLLTNAPGEPRVGHQLATEIASADRIDVVMAFIRRSGITPLRAQLRRHVENGRPLRILTTTYTGSTEAEALELLEDLGAQVRVSFDTSSTRLHAKAWIFHRESGFSTAYVGSSNLTHSAQSTGLEWNIRVSGARNRAVIEKISAVFDSYWEQPEFEVFERARFRDVMRSSRSTDGVIQLSPIEIRLEPFQDRLLEQIEVARQLGNHRNLLVSATGTGKTVMAAVDYARLRTTLPRARLLFVAHRAEILEQSRATFAHALRNASFGELWVGGRRPVSFDHVFASIQSLSAVGFDALPPEHFDVVVVDEFHHAAAASYRRLLEHVRPVELLGLTATPERSDGESVLHWFGDRIAAELRLWDAIDQHRLSPFAYFGIADDLDLRDVPWKRGTGYDIEGVTRLITATDVWARRVLKELLEHVGRIEEVRALGFCVSVEHARYMARIFKDAGVNAVAIWAETPDDERRRVLQELAAGKINVLFSVDLFNEGVDVPAVDTLLMLRPTESALLFLQQLGRGLRKSAGKSTCTVLDFVGQHRKEFRYDQRFRALLGGSRASVLKQIEQGFPFLPAGCHMELDPVASERVIANIKRALPTRWADKLKELRSLAVERPDVTLRTFLELTGLELEDVYREAYSWSRMREEAGLAVHQKGAHEETLRRACGRLLHVDDSERLGAWRAWLASDAPPDPKFLTHRERRLLLMLLVQLFDQIAEQEMTLADAVRMLWLHRQIRGELLELIEVLLARIPHVAAPLVEFTDVPLRVTARYTRQEILCACGVNENVSTLTWREGIRFAREINADLFVFTLDKTKGQFSPTTRYRDYAISRELIHWESQSTTTAESPTGRRYQQHASMGSHILLFGRPAANDRAFHFLGPATYVSHRGEMPMAVTWKLHHKLSGDLFQAYAAAVA